MCKKMFKQLEGKHYNIVDLRLTGTPLLSDVTNAIPGVIFDFKSNMLFNLVLLIYYILMYNCAKRSKIKIYVKCCCQWLIMVPMVTTTQLSLLDIKKAKKHYRKV